MNAAEHGALGMAITADSDMMQRAPQRIVRRKAGAGGSGTTSGWELFSRMLSP